MKRNYYHIIILFILIATGSLFAQTEVLGPILPGEQISLGQLTRRLPNEERTSVGQWLFFDVAYENYFGNAPVGNYVNYIFPDSTILTNPSAPFATWTHAVGQAYDLTSPAWDVALTSNIDFTQPIKIDSIYIWGYYNRVNPSIDTLRLKLYVPAPSNANLWGISYFANASTFTNFNVDTAYFADMTYTQATNTINNPAWTYDIILDSTFYADSNSFGAHEFYVVPSGLTMILNENAFHKGVFGFTTEFVPGYSHNPNVDVIGVDQNGYRPGSAEFNGTDVYPTLTAIGDLTTGYLLHKTVRYNYNTNGWNGYMHPMTAWTEGYSWEYIFIVPYISQINSLAIENHESNANFEIYPNPASAITNVKVIADFSGDAIINIFDLSGKLVKQYSNLNIQKGTNNFALDVTELMNGAYVAQLSSNGNQLNTRLLIAR